MVGTSYEIWYSFKVMACLIHMYVGMTLLWQMLVLHWLINGPRWRYVIVVCACRNMKWKNTEHVVLSIVGIK